MSISNRDITRAVARHSIDISKRLAPSTARHTVFDAITTATNTIWRGWFWTGDKAPDWRGVDPVQTTRDCARLIHFAATYAWVDDSMVLQEGMLPEEMTTRVWGAVQHCLCQALAALGYDLHAEQPLARVLHEPLTGRRMMPGPFGDLCKAAYEADPIGDLVRKLVQWGLSESQVTNLLKTQTTLPQPFTIAVHNKYRTFRLTNSE